MKMKDSVKALLFMLFVVLTSMGCLTVMSSCSFDEEEWQKRQNMIEENQTSYYCPGCNRTHYIRAVSYEFKGHKYIQFGEGERASVVHDPDCECKNQYQPLEYIY